ncbi:MAG: type IV pilus modification protein PilV [Thiomargarita sp.]|nr:type IV pilus modification protein PilV [Thiomargarita sp.]
MSKQIKKIATGFTMLEMLIALLVLSIGLLGVAALQTRGQQFNQVGYLRTQANFLAYDLMDRIRINSDDNANDNGDNGAYAGTSTGIDGTLTCTDDVPTSISVDCDDTDCTVTDLVAYDLIKWCDILNGTLPDRTLSDGTPARDATISWNASNTTYTIIISWDNILDRSDDAEKESSPAWSLQL